jgi:hypothetical protein|tara:strand:+ start:552 stop:728 length:177 start_codon:yes stop_codon:yes gene_type:complete
MKDLGEKIRNKGVESITPGRLGIRTQGKGSFPRINYQTDPEYKKNFEKIFGKKNEKLK